MTVIENTDQEVQHNKIQSQPRQDQIGSLADSARRHIAYERLVRQVAASEAAARQVLEAVETRPRGASLGHTDPEEEQSCP